MSAHHNLLIGGDTRDTRDTTSRDTATLGLGTLQGGTEGTARDAYDRVFAANKHEGEVPRVSSGSYHAIRSPWNPHGQLL